MIELAPPKTVLPEMHDFTGPTKGKVALLFFLSGGHFSSFFSPDQSACMAHKIIPGP